MNKLWKILNAPLIVVLIALAVWPILTVLAGGIAVKLGIEQISGAVSQGVIEPFTKIGIEQDEELKKEAMVINKIEVSNVGFAPISWAKKVKGWSLSLNGYITIIGHKKYFKDNMVHI